MKKAASWLIILLAFVSLVMSHTLVPAIDGKVLVIRGIAFLVTMLIFGMLVQISTRTWIMNRIDQVRRTPMFIAVSAGMGLLIISTIFAFNRYVAFFGELSRGEGFLTLCSVYLLYVAMVVLFQKQEWKKFFTATAVCSLVLFICQLWQLMHGIGRPYATFGNPIFLGSYYLFSFLAAWYLSFTYDSQKLMKWMGFAGIVASILGIFLTETRGVIAGLLVGLVACLVVAIMLGKNKKIGKISIRYAGIGILGLIVISGLLFTATYRQNFWQSVPGINRIADGDTTTLDSRIIYLKITKEGFIKSSVPQKLIGWGWDNFIFFSSKNYDPAVYVLDPTSINRAHNKLADILIMTGVLGLIAYGAIWVLLIRNVWEMTKRNMTIGIGILFVLISYFVSNLFAFDVPVTLFYFYAILAFMTHYDYEKK